MFCLKNKNKNEEFSSFPDDLFIFKNVGVGGSIFPFWDNTIWAFQSKTATALIMNFSTTKAMYIVLDWWNGDLVLQLFKRPVTRTNSKIRIQIDQTCQSTFKQRNFKRKYLSRRYTKRIKMVLTLTYHAGIS